MGIENVKTFVLFLLFASTTVLAVGVITGSINVKDGIVGVSNSVDELTNELTLVNRNLDAIKSTIEKALNDLGDKFDQDQPALP